MPKVISLFSNIIDKFNNLSDDCKILFNDVKFSIGNDHDSLGLWFSFESVHHEDNGPDAILTGKIIDILFDLNVVVKHNDDVEGNWLDITAMISQSDEWIAIVHLRNLLGEGGTNFACVDNVHKNLKYCKKQIKVTYKSKPLKKIILSILDKIEFESSCNKE